jgi:DNA-directed RNA polymerase specialized sigma24 family protein
MLDENALLEKAILGDCDAFVDLIKNNQRYIESAVMKIAKDNDALPNIVQEVIITICKELRNYDVLRKPSTWIYRIAISEGYKYLYKRKLVVTSLLHISSGTQQSVPSLSQ